MRLQSWRGVPLASVCLVVGWLAWPGDLSARRADNPAVLDRQITELQNAGKYADALPLAQRLVALNKARYGEKSAKYATALDRLAATYFFQGQYTEAEPIYAQVLAIRTKVLGPGHESVLSTIVTLADLYRLSNRPQMGEALLQQGLAERERAVGPHHPSLVDALKSLAEIELLSQHYSEAEAHIRRALALSKKAGQDPTQIAQLLGTQAEVERSQGRVEDAERSLKQALSLHEKAGRTETAAQFAHAFALMQLTRLYQQSERYQDATLLAERALAISEKLLGPDHPSVASQLEAVAAMYEIRGRYAEAEPLHKRAVAINDRAYGKESISFAASLKGLGGSTGSRTGTRRRYPSCSGPWRLPRRPSARTSGPVPYLSDVGARYLSQKRYNDAEHFLIRALASLDKAPSVDPFVFGVQLVGILQSLSVRLPVPRPLP